MCLYKGSKFHLKSLLSLSKMSMFLLNAEMIQFNAPMLLLNPSMFLLNASKFLLKAPLLLSNASKFLSNAPFPKIKDLMIQLSESTILINVWMLDFSYERMQIMPPMFLLGWSKEVISMQMMFWSFAMLFISSANMLLSTQKLLISI